MFYLIAHKPFSELIINYVNIYTEFTIGIILITLPIQNTNVRDDIKNNFDDFYLYAIYSVLVAQVSAPIVIVFKKIWFKIKQFRLKKKVTFTTEITKIETSQNTRNEAWKP